MEQVYRPALPVTGRVTPASFPFYTTGEDNLRVVSYNVAAGVKLSIVGRLLDDKGYPSPDRWDHTPNTDRSAATTDITLSGLTLLNLSVQVSAGAPSVGQTFVTVYLIRGTGAAAMVLGPILRGYVTTQLALGFPGSALQGFLDVDGATRTIVGTTPAVGAEILETVPTGARWEVLSVTLSLAMTAAVPNRYPRLAFGPPAGDNFFTRATISEGGGVTAIYACAPMVPVDRAQISTGFMNTMDIGTGRVLTAGERFRTITDNLDTGDQWAAPVYLVREGLVA